MTLERSLRIGFGYLTVTFLAVGSWATLLPRSFYDAFPGGGRQWIAGDGPFNAHLVGDAGVGFLAVGAVLALAARWRERRLMQAALAAVVVHSLPHLGYHLTHLGRSPTAVDGLLSNVALGAAPVLAFALLASSARSGVGTVPAQPDTTQARSGSTR